MVRYLEAFYRHRILLLAPIVLAVAASLGWTVAQPRLYEATARIWVDASSTPTGQSASWNQYTAPSDAQAAVIKELLQTTSFSAKVGRRGPLAQYLENSPNAYNGTLSTITGPLYSLGSTPGPASTDQMDGMLASTLSNRANVIPVGPQVLSITFDAPNPVVAAGTARAIVDEFFDEMRALRNAAAQSTVDFYAAQVKNEPKPSPNDALGQQRYASLQDKLDAARLDLAAQTQPGAGGFRLIDAPAVPSQAKGLRKALLFAGIAGLVIGVSLALLALMLLTWSDTSLQMPEEVEKSLGRRVIGVVPRAR
jgi:uncharacterized protein involved in exopolysaccharide biosynthesis